jgi:hypothetical protein
LGVGYAYANAKGVARNLKAAEFWWLEAAKADNVDAEFGLGTLYYFGIDGKPNYREAAKWFLKAAEHGNAQAKTYIELMKQNGQFDSKTL